MIHAEELSWHYDQKLKGGYPLFASFIPDKGADSAKEWIVEGWDEICFEKFVDS